MSLPPTHTFSSAKNLTQSDWGRAPPPPSAPGGLSIVPNLPHFSTMPLLSPATAMQSLALHTPSHGQSQAHLHPFGQHEMFTFNTQIPSPSPTPKHALMSGAPPPVHSTIQTSFITQMFQRNQQQQQAALQQHLQQQQQQQQQQLLMYQQASSMSEEHQRAAMMAANFASVSHSIPAPRLTTPTMMTAQSGVAAGLTLQPSQSQSQISMSSLLPVPLMSPQHSSSAFTLSPEASNATLKKLEHAEQQRDAAIEALQSALSSLKARNYDNAVDTLNGFLSQYLNTQRQSPRSSSSRDSSRSRLSQSNLSSLSGINKRHQSSAFRAVNQDDDSIRTIIEQPVPISTSASRSSTVNEVRRKRKRSRIDDSEDDSENVSDIDSYDSNDNGNGNGHDSESDDDTHHAHSHAHRSHRSSAGHRKRRDRSCLPCPSITHINKSPIRVVDVHIKYEYTVSKRDAARLTDEEKSQLVKSGVRFLANSVTDDEMFVVAKDLCLLLHTRKGNVAKSIAQFNAREKARMAVLCPRSDGTVSTHELTVLSLEGVDRLLRQARSPTAAGTRGWMFHQLLQMGHPRARLFDNANIVISGDNRVESTIILSSSTDISVIHTGASSPIAITPLSSNRSSIIDTSSSSSSVSVALAAPSTVDSLLSIASTASTKSEPETAQAQ